MHSEMLSNKEITKASYEATAEVFAHRVAELAPLASIEKFIELLPPHPHIIDIGCGSGRDAVLFTNKGARVLGIDYCENLLEIAKRTAPCAEFHLMDIESITLPSLSFDGAWAACSLGHIAKKSFPKVLDKIHFILKEKGCFYLTIKKGEGEVLEKDTRYEGDFKKFLSLYEEEELKEVLSDACFNILEFTAVLKKNAYQSHDAFRVFCQKA
ncbi:class I SAM-dependent DNA methyltransferase [Legionella resiliens]|uniref:Class I SAM-dependent methyltransferase n=1 Tax=Legionella resiliens TaxID=2905958 RepID=A0ABS8X5X7_9GAMM|nr:MULTISPECIES: class I SAM-dependent methyltransferase [unclassified Legionella]MCE0723768.1 class I SAM-dependent methyltransferase [Legionella sp. 9fVS26]MCE3532920.1 class I SAM-dependent methyltransferase [Legionella sp. 8cVS16]